MLLFKKAWYLRLFVVKIIENLQKILLLMLCIMLLNSTWVTYINDMNDEISFLVILITQEQLC